MIDGAIRRVPLLANAASHFPPGQFRRYLLAGAFNTGFGYCSYAAFTAWLTGRIPFAYVVAYLTSSLLNITVAFLAYKWFVFRTKGNYAREWLRAVAVYSGSLLLGFVLLPVVVEAVRRLTGNGRLAPYAGGALLTAFGVIYSFLAHCKFTFRSRTVPAAPVAANGSLPEEAAASR